jgi:hypothetical protein
VIRSSDGVPGCVVGGVRYPTRPGSGGERRIADANKLCNWMQRAVSVGHRLHMQFQCRVYIAG